MTHHAAPSFWRCYDALPESIRRLADKQFALLKENPAHPSLHFKHVGKYRSVRVGRYYRALGVEVPDGVLWWWMGTHAEYDHLVG
ncbi:MAG TPA: hypothetical protein VIJ16_04140 [Gemmatimonadaceae bacterium]